MRILLQGLGGLIVILGFLFLVDSAIGDAGNFPKAAAGVLIGFLIVAFGSWLIRVGKPKASGTTDSQPAASSAPATDWYRPRAAPSRDYPSEAITANRSYAISPPDFGSGDRLDDYRPAPQNVSVLGILSLVLGILGLPLSMIPCLNFIGLPIVVVGLVLGIIGWVAARKGQHGGVGLPVTGTMVSLVGLLISLAWIGLMGYFVMQAAKEEKEIREGPAITIAAVELFDQYDANEPAADSKYKGKVLEVSGTIERVADAGFGDITVELETDGDTVDCEFDRNRKADLAGLRPGQRVTIRGKCKGMVLRFVTLEKCILK